MNRLCSGRPMFPMSKSWKQVLRLDMVERIRPRNQRWLQRFRLDMQMVMPALCQVRDVSLFADREHQSWDASVWISLW